MSLIVRSQHDPNVVVACDGRGVIRLEGEQAWAVEGPSDLIATAFEDLRDVARRVHLEVLHLDFRNSVGVLRVRGLGTLEVVSGKWDMNHFDAMLAEIVRIASALPFSSDTATALPYDRSLSTRDDVLYHSYVYVRHILSESAPRNVQLCPSLRAILAEPYRRAFRETETVAVERVQRVDDTTVLAIARATGPMVRCRAIGSALPAALDGHLPRMLPERQFRTTVDTPENRFVKAFLGSVAGILARMREICTNETRFAQRIRAECRALEDQLAPFVRHPLWRDVGTMTQLPASSTVLQRRRGYREVFRHFILLRLATRHLPISAHQARDLLESRDIAALYELWCYFKVVEVLQRLLGAPSRVDSVKRTEREVSVGREFAVAWDNGLRVLYNATFSRTRMGTRSSYSLPLRPDIAVVLPDGTVHVLDAKFRLRALDVAESDVDRADAKLDDIHKMHTYRDAIEAARSAWVLYPGTEACEFRPTASPAGSVDGVGAVPLAPLDSTAMLESLLRRMVGIAAAATDMPLPSQSPAA